MQWRGAPRPSAGPDPLPFPFAGHALPGLTAEAGRFPPLFLQLASRNSASPAFEVFLFSPFPFSPIRAKDCCSLFPFSSLKGDGMASRGTLLVFLFNRPKEVSEGQVPSSFPRKRPRALRGSPSFFFAFAFQHGHDLAGTAQQKTPPTNPPPPPPPPKKNPPHQKKKPTPPPPPPPPPKKNPPPPKKNKNRPPPPPPPHPRKGNGTTSFPFFPRRNDVIVVEGDTKASGFFFFLFQRQLRSKRRRSRFLSRPPVEVEVEDVELPDFLFFPFSNRCAFRCRPFRPQMRYDFKRQGRAFFVFFLPSPFLWAEGEATGRSDELFPFFRPRRDLLEVDPLASFFFP